MTSRRHVTLKGERRGPNTAGDTDSVTTEHLWEMTYCESNSHVPDDVTAQS